jgi:hypothetical protein
MVHALNHLHLFHSLQKNRLGNSACAYKYPWISEFEILNIFLHSRISQCITQLM